MTSNNLTLETFDLNNDIENNISSSPVSTSSSELSASPIFVRKQNRTVNYGLITPKKKYCRKYPSPKDTFFKICRICDNDIKDLCTLRCGHSLCLQCFVNWFKNNKTCPFCRLSIDIEVFQNNDRSREELNINRNLVIYINDLENQNTELRELNNRPVCSSCTKFLTMFLIMGGIFFLVSNSI